MKATVSSSALSAALGLVSRAVSPRSTLPVLGNVLLETSDTGLRVTATNLDLTITANVPAEIQAEGRTTVPARLLSEYIGSLGEAQCTMDLDPTTQVLRLACGVHRANLHGIDAVEFPPLPKQEADAAVGAGSVAREHAIPHGAGGAGGASAAAA